MSLFFYCNLTFSQAHPGTEHLLLSSGHDSTKNSFIAELQTTDDEIVFTFNCNTPSLDGLADRDYMCMLLNCIVVSFLELVRRYSSSCSSECVSGSTEYIVAMVMKVMMVMMMVVVMLVVVVVMSGISSCPRPRALRDLYDSCFLKFWNRIYKQQNAHYQNSSTVKIVNLKHFG